MRAAGIHGLVSLSRLGGHRFLSLAPYESAEAVGQHMETVPDQGRHLQRMANSVGEATMPGLASKLGYDGPLELLSMWTCLFGSSALAGVAKRGLDTTVVLERARWP
jgi:hypothetical protein